MLDLIHNEEKFWEVHRLWEAPLRSNQFDRRARLEEAFGVGVRDEYFQAWGSWKQKYLRAWELTNRLDQLVVEEIEILDANPWHNYNRALLGSMVREMKEKSVRTYETILGRFGLEKYHAQKTFCRPQFEYRPRKRSMEEYRQEALNYCRERQAETTRELFSLGVDLEKLTRDS